MTFPALFCLRNDGVRIQRHELGPVCLHASLQLPAKPLPFALFLALVVVSYQITDVFARRTVKPGRTDAILDEPLKLTRKSDVDTFGHNVSFRAIPPVVPQFVKFVGQLVENV
jgi:hypothetical protein